MCDSDGNYILSDLNVDEVSSINEQDSQEAEQDPLTAITVAEDTPDTPKDLSQTHEIPHQNGSTKVESKKCPSPISSSRRKNVSSPRSQNHARGTSKSRIPGGKLRPSRTTRRSKPRFENYISSNSPDRDTSIDSYDSIHGQQKRRTKSTKSDNSRTTSSLKKNCSCKPRSATSQTSTSSRSTNVSQESTPVPLYESSVKKGIRKNTKRDISDGAMCPLKWEPKAHKDLSGCERCLSFAAEKELAAYHTNGHHHRIMMTRGGCNKCCTLFPRKCSQSAPRLCQRCFHDTHLMKLW